MENEEKRLPWICASVDSEWRRQKVCVCVCQWAVFLTHWAISWVFFNFTKRVSCRRVCNILKIYVFKNFEVKGCFWCLLDKQKKQAFYLKVDTDMRRKSKFAAVNATVEQFQLIHKTHRVFNGLFQTLSDFNLFQQNKLVRPKMWLCVYKWIEILFIFHQPGLIKGAPPYRRVFTGAIFLTAKWSWTRMKIKKSDFVQSLSASYANETLHKISKILLLFRKPNPHLHERPMQLD